MNNDTWMTIIIVIIGLAVQFAAQAHLIGKITARLDNIENRCKERSGKHEGQCTKLNEHGEAIATLAVRMDQMEGLMS